MSNALRRTHDKLNGDDTSFERLGEIKSISLQLVEPLIARSIVNKADFQEEAIRSLGDEKITENAVEEPTTTSVRWSRAYVFAEPCGPEGRRAPAERLRGDGRVSETAADAPWPAILPGEADSAPQALCGLIRPGDKEQEPVR